jgi:membrane protease subunit HflC
MRTLSAFVAILLVLLGANALFVVKEGESALLLQFGRIVGADYKPGLHFKLPFVQQALRFDQRILGLDAQPERYFTSEKKSVIVDFYVKWRIADVGKYYVASTGSELQANTLLAPKIKDALRFEFNGKPLQEIIAGSRNDITQHARDQANKTTRDSLGIEVVDVRIKRIDLPEEVSDSVFERMRAERKKVANELRSTGEEAAAKIKADADRQRVVLVAEANRTAQQARGEGDAKAAEIYAQAYGKDAEFYAFYRSLEAYRASFGSGHGVLLLDPKSEFFRYFDASK